MEKEQTEPAATVARPSKLKMWVPPCGFAALILVFSSTPGAYFPEHPDLLNNIVHFLEFGILAFLLARTLYNGYSLSRTGLFLGTTAVCVSFGLLDETHQFMVPERVFDLVDLAFDTLGASAGSAIFVLLTALKTSNPPEISSASGGVND